MSRAVFSIPGVISGTRMSVNYNGGGGGGWGNEVWGECLALRKLVAEAALPFQALGSKTAPRWPGLLGLQVFTSMESPPRTIDFHASSVASFLGFSSLFWLPLSLITFQTRMSRVIRVIKSAKKKRTFIR